MILIINKMRLFRRSKKESSCCNVQFEEVKKDNKKKNSCCDGDIEELMIKPATKQSDKSL
jgi:hypothetical protein